MAASAGNAATVEDAVAFIARHPHVYLLGRRADGYPTGYAMMSRAHDGVVEFSTYRSSAKVKNLEREGTAGILAVSKDDDQVMWASGGVSVHDGYMWGTGDSPPAETPGAFRPNVPRDITEKVSNRHETGKRCVVRVTLSEARFATRLV